MTPYKILFYLQKVKDKSDCLLRLRVTWDNKKVHANMGFYVNPLRWSPDTQRCAIKSYHGKDKISAAIINSAIDQTRDRINEAFTAYNLSGKTPTEHDIKRIIKGADTDTNSMSLPVTDTYNEFIEEMSLANGWADGTVKRHISVRNHLTEYDPNLMTNQLTAENLQKYLRWLVEVKQFKNVTTLKEFGYIKWFIRWLERKGKYKGNALQNFEVRLKKYDKEIIYLTWDELTRVRQLELTGMEDAVRDGFCLCCFTGLRYSDLRNLKSYNIVGDTLHITTIKTKDKLVIELNKYSREILEKYAGKKQKEDRAIPCYVNQDMNRVLKSIGKKAELFEPITLVSYKGNERVENTYQKWELLTTHCGRRTFVVNAMYLGISDAIIMEWTGHSSVEAMKPYRKVVDEAKKREMAKFDSL